mgnify:FL=1
MSRTVSRHLPSEMALLASAELAISFLLIDTVLVESRGYLSNPSFPPPGASWAAVLTLGLVGVAASIGLYRSETLFDGRSLVRNATLASLAAFPIGLLLLEDSTDRDDAGRLAAVLGTWCGCVLLFRGLLRLCRDRTVVRRILVVGRGERADRLCALLRSPRFRRWEPVRASSDPYCLTASALREQRIWAVVLACAPDSFDEGAILLESKVAGIRVLDDTTFHEAQLGRLDLDTLTPARILTSEGFHVSRGGALARRATDLVVSSLLLLLMLPLMLVVAALIRLESPGPVLYRQRRAGQHGVPFVLLKFRSMRQDAESGTPRWAQEGDPRVTRIGRIMRPMRIDELPQLLNVLRGDMSMVGPRPERPHFVTQLTRVIPFYDHRAAVRPGLTGWAQVNFPYGASIEDAREKLAYNLYYVKNRTVFLDLVILFSTVRVVLFREGAR